MVCQHKKKTTEVIPPDGFWSYTIVIFLKEKQMLGSKREKKRKNRVEWCEQRFERVNLKVIQKPRISIVDLTFG